MIKFKRTGTMLLALAIIGAASLACSLPGRVVKPPASYTPIPVNTQAVGDLRKNLEVAASQIANGGSTNLVIDEAQLTSLLAIELKSQDRLNIQDPQVYLRDGQVQLFGNLQQGNLTVPVKIILSLSSDGKGLLQFQVIEATAGPLPVPKSLLDQFTSQFDQALEQKLNSDNNPVFIDSIVIADGKMTITAHAQ
jgi:uncharacterized protein YpmS